MSKSDKKINKNILALRHTNLMLASTTVSMCTGLVLLLIYTALKGTMNSFVMARIMCGVFSALFLVAAVVLTVMAIKKDKFLCEFAIFSIVMSFGFLSMLGVPFFLSSVNDIAKFFVTKYVIFEVAVVDVLYLVISLIYHTVKSMKRA